MKRRQLVFLSTVCALSLCLSSVAWGAERESTADPDSVSAQVEAALDLKKENPAPEALGNGLDPLAEGETYTRGYAGYELSWYFQPDSGTLIITGQGDMFDYDLYGAPWYQLGLAEQIKHVCLPYQLKYIGQAAFAGCTNLSDVVIPQKLGRIGAAAFYECKSLTYLVLNDSMTIGDYAFAFSGLTNISLPTNYSDIGNGAFAICAANGLTIPSSEKYTAIRDQCFASKNTTIENITIPDTITSIGEKAFAEANPAGRNIYYTGTEAQWNAIVKNADTGLKLDSNAAIHDTITFDAASISISGLLEGYFSGIITSVQNITLTCSDSKAEIHYTLDGSIPTLESTLYTEPIKIDRTERLQAKAFVNGIGVGYTDRTFVAQPAISIEGQKVRDVANTTMKLSCPLNCHDMICNLPVFWVSGDPDVFELISREI